MGMFPVFLSAAVASAGIPATQPRDPVRPALWMVSDGDTTIYLFGTFHALDGSSNWFRDRVRTAFAEADELVLETLVPRHSAARPATRPGGQARSAFADSTRMVLDAGRQRGMSPGNGADAALRLAAEGSGKPVGALESFEFQINMFSALSRAPQLQPAAQARLNAPNPIVVSAVLAKLQDAWVRGDTATFEPMLEQMRAQSPIAYRTMFVERNSRWASWIAGRLDQPGTVFVAVGAGHLAGRDSVQAQLAAIGVGSVRVN